MDPANPTAVPQADGVDVTPAAGDAAATNAATLTLDEINAITGKTYKDKETALKSLKDMSSMAGKAADQMGRKPETVTDTERIKALELDNFYARNPEHEANRDILEALADKNGVSVKEAIELPAYKSMLEKTAASVETKKPRTVAAPNGRTAQPSSNKSPIQAAVATGDADAMAAAVTEAFLNK